jgi:hypothetical protein
VNVNLVSWCEQSKNKAVPGRTIHQKQVNGHRCHAKVDHDYIVAIEDEILDSNPAARIGRFTRSAKGTEVKGIALTTTKVQLLLEAAETICPEYHMLFLMAVRE